MLKAFIHCEGCEDKISRCLKGLEGNILFILSLYYGHMLVSYALIIKIINQILNVIYDD